MNSFKPSSQALSFIWYCPDHVRAWRKSVYEELGGHNKELSVCDDHELLIRTYLKTKFYYIPKCLYIYRHLEDGKNTYLTRNAEVQTTTVDLQYKYAYKLAERDCELKGLMKIDLGGGLHGREGYTTLDKEGADIICNLDEGIPLVDNSVGVLNASHVIEHLKDPIHTMREIHRVLCHGGWAMIEVPSTDGRGAWMDPTHVSYWNENSFLYYTAEAQAQYIRNKDIKFQSFKCETYYPNKWYKDMNIPCVVAYLSCVKDGERLPHQLRI
jgi:SAM-dependent methyltransferase